MVQGSYRVAVQHGKRAYFAVVALEVTVGVGAAETVRVANDSGEPTWKAGMRFGIAYAYERTLKRNWLPPGVEVRITEFRGHVVDTTEIVVAFAAAQAFYAALELPPPPELQFDPASGIFSFPK